MKNTFYIVVVCCLAFACRPALKIKKTEQVVVKADTTTAVTSKNTEATKATDSLVLRREVYRRILKNQIDFNTFSAKVKVDYVTKGSTEDFTAYVRIQRDSVIWMSLRGALGIEGARALITNDSVIILNMLKKEVTRRSISFLQEFTKLPFTFNTLQDVIIGNPVFIDSNILSYQKNSQNELEVLMAGKIFQHLITLNNTDNKIVSSKLDDKNVAGNRTCNITFTNYDFSAGVPFATKRKISITEKSALDINLDFKTFSFNQPVTFPFAVTKNFKER